MTTKTTKKAAPKKSVAVKAKTIVAKAKTTPRGKGAKQLTKKMRGSILTGGLVAMAFGLFAIFWPGLTLEFVIWVFGLFVIAMGLLWAYQVLTHMKTNRLWWLAGLAALTLLVFGILILVNNAIMINIFVVVLTIYIFAQALLDFIIASYSDDKTDRWVWIMIGFLGIVFGFVIILNPLTASMAFMWVMGLYVLVHGMAAVVYAMKAKRSLR